MLPTVAVFDAVRKFFSSIEHLSKSPKSELNQTNRLQLQCLNYFGMSYTIVYSLLLFGLTFFLTIPFVYSENISESDDESIIFYRWLLIYTYFNFLANYVLIWYGAVKSIHCTPKELPLHSASTREDWQNCKSCNKDVPPRTHHCPLCNMCVLKRDHHCFFTGCCIGFYNQRYFICGAFHCLLVCCLSFFFMIEYLSFHYVTFLGPEFFKYFLPYAFGVFVFGHTPFSIFLLIVVFYLNLTTLIAAVFYLLWQFNLIKNGQTSYEFVKGKKTFQSKISTHIQSIFGPLWLLNFIFPMPCLKNVGTGKSWPSGNTKFL